MGQDSGGQCAKKANWISAPSAAFWVITEMDVSVFDLAEGKFTVITLPKSEEMKRFEGACKYQGVLLRLATVLSALWWRTAVFQKLLLNFAIKKVFFFSVLSFVFAGSQ